MRAEPALAFEARDLGEEDLAYRRVLVAEVDVDRLRFHRPGGDEHALQEPVGTPLEVIPVLEGAGLALVGVHRHEARAGVGADDAPLAAGREAGPPEPAKAGFVENLDRLVHRAAPRPAVLEDRKPAALDVGVVVLVIRYVGVGIPRRGRRENGRGRRVVDVAVADFRNGRGIATSHAGGADHPHPVRAPLLQGGHERDGPRKLAREAVAHPHGDGRRRGSAVRHDVEVGVERRGLVHLGLGEAVLGGESREMPGAERAETVLDEMQVLDEVIALVRTLANEAADVLARGGIDLPALGRRPPPPAAPPVRGNRARLAGRRGTGGGARPGPGPGLRRTAPRHQEHPPDSARKPGGRRLAGVAIVRGRSDITIAIALPSGWWPRGRRRRLSRRLRPEPSPEPAAGSDRRPADRRQTYRPASLDAMTGAGSAGPGFHTVRRWGVHRHPPLSRAERGFASFKRETPRIAGMAGSSGSGCIGTPPGSCRSLDAMMIESGGAARGPHPGLRPRAGAGQAVPCPSTSAASTSGARLPTA